MKRTTLSVFCAMAMAGRLLAATCSPSQFVQAASHPAGARATAVVVAFIDGDAIPDIVTANDGSVSVLLGQGGGEFSAPIVTPVNGAYAIAAGDFDGDTNTDLAVGYYSEIYILLGHGDGTFDPPVEYSIGGGQIVAIQTGTFDANASLDLAAVDFGSGGRVTILLGAGDGTFGPATSFSAPGAQALTTGDFDDDGKIDLASSNFSLGTVSVLAGAGDGTFDPPVSFLAGANPSGIAAADLDGDGNLDLVTSTNGFISVLLGDGNRTFQAALQYSTGVSSGQVAVADFDGDGIPDVAAAALSGGYFGSGGVSVLAGQGDGSFGPPAVYIGGVSSSGLAVGDLNGDSLPDLVTADPDQQAVTVFLDQTGGSLFAAPLSSVQAIPSPVTFAQADFDGDGFTDLAFGSGSTISFILGGPHGTFRPGTSLQEPNFQTVNGVAAGSFVAGGPPDVISSSYSGLSRYPNLGGGVFGPPEQIFSNTLFTGPAVADFNFDGKLDIAVPVSCCGVVSMVVVLGNGDGTFQTPVQTDYFINNFQILVTADVTGDGKTDLVGYTSPGILLLPGNGDGTFGAAIAITADSGYSQAATGDFNGDGHPDLILSGNNPSAALLLGNGDGTFQTPILIALSGSASGLVVGDFSGDGALDFAVLVVGRLLLFDGLGNGHFQTPVEFVTSGNPFALVASDFDGNGALDLALAGNSSITTFLNTRLSAVVHDVSVIVGSPVVLSVSAAGFGPVTYQWRRDGIPLSDGGPISGSTTATLTIDPVAFTDAGSYDVVVTDSCADATSNTATLSVEFDDVPLTNPFHDDIITIAISGITGGCTTTSYCPSNDVSRAEMAVLLLKSKFGADHVPPPPPPDPIFPDVPADAFAAAWIDELATLGITGGCGDGNGDYCPDAPVTRGQMAVFLLKTLLGSGYVPPTPAGIFADVPSDYFAIAWIEDLYNRGITAGCLMSPLSYCPDQSVPREQMATFIVRTFLTP
ncbi:MAG: FG-GAP-like repeat-containing protein [Acidobacteriota bacterium]